MEGTPVSEHDQAWLVEQPETGMGYQLLRLSKQELALVVATLLLIRFRTREQLFERLSRQVEGEEEHTWQAWQGTLPTSKSEVVGAKVVDRDDPIVVNMLQSGPQRKVRSKTTELFHDRPLLALPRMFFRFSASPRDRRILPGGGFARGTYATTFNDLRMVPSGLAAVGRYALPVPSAARFVYAVVTNSPHRMGTALPNFSQSGGGVEVFFHSGATALPGHAHRLDVG